MSRPPPANLEAIRALVRARRLAGAPWKIVAAEVEREFAVRYGRTRLHLLLAGDAEYQARRAERMAARARAIVLDNSSC